MFDMLSQAAVEALPGWSKLLDWGLTAAAAGVMLYYILSRQRESDRTIRGINCTVVTFQQMILALELGKLRERLTQESPDCRNCIDTLMRIEIILKTQEESLHAIFSKDK